MVRSQLRVLNRAEPHQALHSVQRSSRSESKVPLKGGRGIRKKREAKDGGKAGKVTLFPARNLENSLLKEQSYLKRKEGLKASQGSSQSAGQPFSLTK